VAYLGLNPRVRQSGNSPAVHGRITKAGPAQARGMLGRSRLRGVAGPGTVAGLLPASKVKDRRGFQVATVAVARKLAVLCWHLVTKGRRLRVRPASLTAHKRRKLELAAGAKPRRGPVARPSHDYFIRELRDQGKTVVAQAERAYEVAVAHWQPKRSGEKR
jgi:transposase